MDPRARTLCADSKVAFPPLLSNIVRRPQRERHDGEGGVLLAGTGEAASVGHEEILHLPRLAEAVQDGGLRIFSHANCAYLMAGKPSRSFTEVMESFPLQIRANLHQAPVLVAP